VTEKRREWFRKRIADEMGESITAGSLDGLAREAEARAVREPRHGTVVVVVQAAVLGVPGAREAEVAPRNAVAREGQVVAVHDGDDVSDARCVMCGERAVARAEALLRIRPRSREWASPITGPAWAWPAAQPVALCWACLTRDQRRWPRGTRWRVAVKEWLSTTVTT